MALMLYIHAATGFSVRSERLIKAVFRGKSHYTKPIENEDSEVVFDQWFEWPIGRPVESQESLEIQLLNYNKYFTNKIIGSYNLVLQKLVEDGQLRICDSFLDSNNMPTDVMLEFEVRYSAPDGSVVDWQASGMHEAGVEDDKQALIVIEHNIANLERSIQSRQQQQLQSRHQLQHQQSLDAADPYSSRQGQIISASSRSLDRKKSLPATMRSLASMMKLGKQRHPDEDERKSLKESDHLEYGSTQTLNLRMSEPSLHMQDQDDDALLFRQFDDNSSDVAPYSIRSPVVVKKWGSISRQKSRDSSPSNLKAQDFQVCITVIEARHLAGLNMDPVVCVQVGDQKKFTSIKESTNCPYYNEYFVFDFHMTPMMFFDKMISLTVLHSRNIIRSGKIIGIFKLDVGTVFSQQEHQFYHKWALLTDPDDITAGPKGYLKCDISVTGKGDQVKLPPKSDKDEDDIEANLLLPDGVPAERQHARFVVKIFRADGLPKMNAGIVANVKKAFTGESKDCVDPYVQVSFAGLMGKTSVRKNTCCPTWAEQIVFTEMFPPLCQRIKIQLKDSDSVNNSVIGTHFIELSKISNEGEKGFLPTFGPSFVYLYGSPRDYSIFDEHTTLNDGLGEGVMYRGKLLIAVKTEILDTMEMTPPEVDVELTNPISEGSYGRNDEFFLFGCVLEATMIDRKIGEKPIYFELTIGNAGNLLDSYRSAGGGGDEDDIDSVSGGSQESVYGEASIPIQSTTPPLRPSSKDRQYYYIPYGDNKPCVWVRSIWQDHRRRLYNSNVLAKIADKLDEGLSDVQEMIRLEKPHADRRLRGVLEELVSGCNRYLQILKGVGNSASSKTKLDKERVKLCIRELDHMATMCRTMKPLVTQNTIKEKLRTAQGFLKKIKDLAEDPQHALPDIFVWMISGGKRVAYQRIPARELIFSIVEEECGKYCGKAQTLFLKLPGKKGAGPGGWAIQSKLQMYMWLGVTKHKKYFLKGLPKGYDSCPEIKNSDKLQSAPPAAIHYSEKQVFELRCHMYQARSLIGSDSSGLSDPFARVLFSDQSQTTQVIDETLSPTWDEMLLFSNVIVYGNKEDIKEDPPIIVVEIFDQDKVGKSEFIGRTIARPHVKFGDEPYVKPHFPPDLEWHDIFRGSEQAGELLATFELLQMSDSDEKGTCPELPRPKENIWRSDRGPILPVPMSIRPTLSKYRIEVLFWGLRELKRVHLMTVDRPRVDVECAGNILQSSVIMNYKKNPNFSIPVKHFDVELPDQEMYCPPLTIRVMDCRSFGRFTLVGTHVINSLQKYIFKPTSKRDREQPSRYSSQPTLTVQQDDVIINIDDDNSTREMFILMDFGGKTKKDLKTEANKKKKRQAEEDGNDDDEENKDWWTRYFASQEEINKGNDIVGSVNALSAVGSNPLNGDVHNSEDGYADRWRVMIRRKAKTKPTTVADSEELNAKDAKKADKDLQKLENQQQQMLESGGGSSTASSTHLQHQDKEYKKRTFKGTSTAVRLAARLSPKSQQKKIISKESLIKIFPCELENVPDFGGFNEWLHSFELFRGKRTGDELEDQNRTVGIFKGSLKVYKTPLPRDVQDPYLPITDPLGGLFQGLPNNEPLHVLVRVYVVKATDLHPADLNGKADPYIVINLGGKKANDKENYISKQLHPVFGKLFEFEATFPQESLLVVQIYDWDLLGSDDLIGETKVDLENRYYSRHRPICGIPQKYETYGPNQWRDPLKPSQMLTKLCKDLKLDGPHIIHNRIRIGNRAFTFQVENEEDVEKLNEEHMALEVLHRWSDIPKAGYKLVPEHVETRPLFNPEKPGIEQGKLEMWVDMFPMDMPLPSQAVDISPRKPTSYELRITIWNTDDVVLEDDAFFTGEKMSDIYVKGWLKGPEDTQSTDIHYRSLTGEGNFNWRFIYPFDYLPAEEKIVISRKESLFSWDETECKIPARLELQVWDADHFSADDFLGAITLDLNRFPRGAKSSKLCTLNMLKTDGSVPMVSLFKQKRIKGWWPFFVTKDNDELELTGKVEAELQLLSKEEAEKSPAGLGRNEPDPLEKPNRPDSTFIWFLNPLKSIRYIIWHNYKWKILKAFMFLVLIIFLSLFVYSLPGYTVKRIIGA